MAISAMACATEPLPANEVHPPADSAADGNKTASAKKGTTAAPAHSSSSTGSTTQASTAPSTATATPTAPTSTTTPAKTTPVVTAKKPIPCTTDVDSVTQSYHVALQRDPDQDGLNNWVAAIQNGKTRLNVLEEMVHSEEWNDLNAPENVTDDQFVEFQYVRFFNRQPDADGKAFWLGQLANGTARSDVAQAFADSDEFKDPNSNFATACYF